MKRTYPERPIAAVGAIIFDEGRVLLVRRKVDPYMGRWSIPGGAIELGERARDAIVREVREECGVEVEPLHVVDVYDNIVEDEGGLRYHYTVIDFLARHLSGRPKPGSDVEKARWVPLSELDRYEMTPLARMAISRALATRRDDAG
ncbi:MAG: NUDIX hydrolase [Thermoplasmata archaeon]